MKGTALIISKMKGIRKICSQMFPFQERMNKNESQLYCILLKGEKTALRISPAIRMLPLTKY